MAKSCCHFIPEARDIVACPDNAPPVKTLLSSLVLNLKPPSGRFYNSMGVGPWKSWIAVIAVSALFKELIPDSVPCT